MIAATPVGSTVRSRQIPASSHGWLRVLSSAEGDDDAAASAMSPCVRICRLDAAQRICEGCLRTLDEIATWSSLDAEGRRRINARVAERRLLAGREEPSEPGLDG